MDDSERHQLETTIADLRARLADAESRLRAGEGGQGAAAYGTAPVATDAVDPWSVPPWPQVVSLLRSRKKIEAIKVYREHFAVGLQQAKETVEEVERRLG